VQYRGVRKSLFRKGLAHFRRGQCIKGLGDIALARSDHAGARRNTRAALRLYNRVACVWAGQCILSMGDLETAAI